MKLVFKGRVLADIQFFSENRSFLQRKKSKLTLAYNSPLAFSPSILFYPYFYFTLILVFSTLFLPLFNFQPYFHPYQKITLTLFSPLTKIYPHPIFTLSPISPLFQFQPQAFLHFAKITLTLFSPSPNFTLIPIYPYTLKNDQGI